MCSSCLKAPLNDLSIYNKLLRYKRVDKKVAHAALSTMRRHMAYMKPETVVLRLASKSVNAKEKTAMAQSLLASPRGCNDAEEDVLFIYQDTELTDLFSPRIVVASLQADPQCCKQLAARHGKTTSKTRILKGSLILYNSPMMSQRGEWR